ncbi:MAG: porphobilinogen synthase, partial [Candidatus Porifericomitaceae bacterium WSBS_2022_MAG_OTU9]
MRRLRRTANLRALVQSHKLHQSNLIQPLFVSAGSAAG